MTDTPQVSEAVIEAGRVEALRQFGSYRVDLLTDAGLAGSCRYIYLAMTAARPAVGEEELVERVAKMVDIHALTTGEDDAWSLAERIVSVINQVGVASS